MKRKILKTTSGKRGGRSLLGILLAAAAVLALNLLVSRLPTALTHLDLSETDLLELSDQTRQRMEALNRDVTLYYYVQPGNEDLDTRELLQRYGELTDRLHLVRRDPLLYPGFAAQYGQQSLAENSVVVESQLRYSVLTPEDIYVSDYLYDYDSYTYSENQSFQGEQALTRAIDFVVTDQLPTVRVLTGHGETALPATLRTQLEGQNLSLAELDLLSAGAVPEDTDCLLLAAPTGDLSQPELAGIRDYLSAGGAVLLLTGFEAESLPNLMALAGDFDAVLCPGIVLEADGDRSLSGYQYYLLPELVSHPITDALLEEGRRVLLPMAQGIRLTGAGREGLEVSALLATGDGAYSKAEGLASQTLAREDKDLEGPFLLALLAQQEGGGRLAWCSSAMVLDPDTNALVSGGNYAFLACTLGQLCGRESTVAIPGKSLMNAYLAVPAAWAARWNVLFIALLPLGLLAVAAIIWYRRTRA